MTRKRLDDATVRSRLASIPGWSLREGQLHRELQFKDFVEAFAFVSAVALIAEAMNHHPQWSNVWNGVTLDLSTHDAGGITDLDFTLAARINERLAAREPAK